MASVKLLLVIFLNTGKNHILKVIVMLVRFKPTSTLKVFLYSKKLKILPCAGPVSAFGACCTWSFLLLPEVNTQDRQTTNVATLKYGRRIL